MDIYSDDHIFMDAMGGKKKVRACKTCYDHCGATFEVQNLKETIRRLYCFGNTSFLAAWGFLFHKGIIGAATLFSFPLYGVLPGLVVEAMLRGDLGRQVSK